MKIEGSRLNLYAYGWGLVSGLSSQLFTKKDFESLIISKDVSDLLNQLSTTPYNPYLKSIGVNPSLYEIQKRIDSSFENSYDLVCSCLDDKDRHMVDLLMRGLWDLQNLKTYIRAKEHNSLKNLSYYLNDFGSFPAKTFSDASTDEEVLLRVLPPSYTLILEKALGKDLLVDREHSIDMGFLDLMLSETKGEMRDYALLLADVLNIRTIILCKMNGVDAKNHVVRNGYYISQMRLDELLRSDLSSQAKLLEATPYHQAVYDVVSKSTDKTIETLDMKLNNVLSNQMRLAGLEKPLSINPSLSYLKSKEDEVKSLKAVVAGIWHGFPKDEIRGLIS